MHTHTRAQAEIIEMLLQNGINPTRQRVQIASVMLNQAQHLTAEAVLASANDRGAQVSKATVYNTLGLFVEKGLIRELFIDPDKIVYDSNTAKHHHFYNVDTGELTDIEPQHVDLSKMPPLPAGTRSDSVDVIIRIRQA